MKKKDAKGRKIMKTYEDFGKDYDKFTDYVMDRIDIDEREKIRKDWNKKDKENRAKGIKGGKEMRWHTYLLKRVNEKSYAKGGKTPKYNYSIPFLKFYQEFFEEDGEKFTLEEVNDKLIEDEIQEYDIKEKDDEDMIEIFPLDKNGDNIKLF